MRLTSLLSTVLTAVFITGSLAAPGEPVVSSKLRKRSLPAHDAFVIIKDLNQKAEQAKANIDQALAGVTIFSPAEEKAAAGREAAKHFNSLHDAISQAVVDVKQGSRYQDTTYTDKRQSPGNLVAALSDLVSLVSNLISGSVGVVGTVGTVGANVLIPAVSSVGEVLTNLVAALAQAVAGLAPLLGPVGVLLTGIGVLTGGIGGLLSGIGALIPR